MKVIIEPIEGIPQETISMIERAVEKEINKEFSLTLDIELLEDIVFTQNFGKSVLEFQRKKGIVEGYGSYSRSDTVGKTIEYFEGNQKKFIIFIKIEVLNEVLTPEGPKPWAIHVIHHELAHVHDWTQRNKMLEFQKKFERSGLNGYENGLRTISMIIWDEYIAERLSVKTNLDENIITSEQFLEKINRFEREARKIATQIALTNDENAARDILILTTELFKGAALLLGNIHGRELNISNYKGNEIIKETYFVDIWIKMELIILKLYQSYPEWKEIALFNELIELISNTLNEYSFLG